MTNSEVNTAMKFRTTKRHLREGTKNIWRNGWMTIASVGAVTTTLILVAAFLMLMLNLNEIANNIEEDVEIKAFVNLTAEDAQIEELGQKIESVSGVESVAYSTKEEELNKLINGMGEGGESWKLFEQDNPLNAAYIVKTDAPDDTFTVANKIEEMESIHKVTYGQETVQNLYSFNEYARTIGLVLIIGLVFTAIFLISNTIKITIIARKTEIGIMKLVGATNGFIRWPFFVEGLLLGVLGTIIPIAGVLGGYYYLYNNVSQFNKFEFINLLPFNPFAWQLSLLILAIGAFIGVWGSVMSVRKFLKV